MLTSKANPNRWRFVFLVAALLIGTIVTASVALASLSARPLAGVPVHQSVASSDLGFSNGPGNLLASVKQAAHLAFAPVSPSCIVSFTGTIELGDPVQSGRLNTLANASTCANARGCPGVFDSLPRHYDAYTFTNTNTTATCVTVGLTPALINVFLQSAAYLNSFNPLDPCENYLADIGPVPSVSGGSYSFNVPAGATYIVVVNELAPNVGTPLGYTLTVNSDPNCPVQTTPTATPNGATQTSVVATRTAQALTATPIPTATACTVRGIIESTDGTQAGRLNTLANASTCANARGCPGVFDSLPRHYDAYTYVNTSNTAACILVNVTPDVAQTIQSAAYLGSFNPLNPCTNYLADIGPVPSVLGGSYSFDVPAGATFVVVLNELVPNVGSPLGYTLTVSSPGGLTCPTGATATPTPNLGATQTSIIATLTALARTSTPVPTATVCVITGAIDPTDGTQAGRLNSLLTSSTCAAPRNCPGTLDTLTRHYDAYTYYNASNTAACVTVALTASCVNSLLIQSASYLGSFDPNNLCVNYLADIGPSPAPIGSYSFTVPAGATFVVTVNELVPNTGCSSYTLAVSSSGGLTCPITSGTPTSTPNVGATQTSVSATQTALATPATPCPIQFNDVPTTNPFYTYIRCLVCRGIISGYDCGGPGEPCPGRYFRSFNNVTRGQTTKMAANSAGFFEPVPSTQQTFQDVPNTNPFWVYIERLASRGYINGYDCGGPGEPCVPPRNRPYFRWANDVTRGQLSKIVSNSAGYTDPIPQSQQTFQDVPHTDPFWVWIERIAMRGVISGYNCGQPPAGPCVPPDDKPYFLTYNHATRGQTSKIVANTFFPNCQTPSRK